ncbi:hypothetical protein O3P69_000919 [Scylla paramamosain]|uniref:Uncharacterized protein n=1 Tax=Scylla paramamosain TaxID=85552 RepID=A0AAW0UTE4_SCYPA
MEGEGLEAGSSEAVIAAGLWTRVKEKEERKDYDVAARQGHAALRLQETHHREKIHVKREYKEKKTSLCTSSPSHQGGVVDDASGDLYSKRRRHHGAGASRRQYFRDEAGGSEEVQGSGAK